MNARQPQELTSKHQSKKDGGKNVYHRMLAPGCRREKGLKSFKALRSEPEALWPSIRDLTGYRNDMLRPHRYLGSLTLEDVNYETYDEYNDLTEIIKSSASSLGVNIFVDCFASSFA